MYGQRNTMDEYNRRKHKARLGTGIAQIRKTWKRTKNQAQRLKRLYDDI